MGQMKVQFTVDIEASVETVFARLSDHEDMANWPGGGAVRLTREGEPRNGLGAIREIKASGLTLLEEVVMWDAPNGFDYTIIKGLPVDHMGRVRVENRGGIAHVTWDIEMTSRWPLLCAVVKRSLEQLFPGGLNYVRAEAERTAAAA